MLLQKQQIEAATWTNPAIREFNDWKRAPSRRLPPTPWTWSASSAKSSTAPGKDRCSTSTRKRSLSSQMLDYIRRRLIMEDRPVSLSALLRNTRSERALICMFLALLELVRLQAVLLRQDRELQRGLHQEARVL